MSGSHSSDPKPHGESSLTKLVVSISGASPADHETEPPGADGTSVKAGHEPDSFDVKGILYVPAFVVIACVIAYVIVSTLFATIVRYDTNVDRPMASELNKPDISDRFARISSTQPRAVAGDKSTIVPQPRLEYLKESTKENDNDKQFVRSKRGNDTPSSTYEIRPEDLRPEFYRDPLTKERTLLDPAYVGADHKFVRVPVNDAIKLTVEKKLLPISKTTVVVSALSNEKAKLSNGGRSSAALLVDTTPAGQPAPKPEEKKPEEKTPEPKK